MSLLHRAIALIGVVLLVATMSGACSTATDVGGVVVHNWDPVSGEESPWIGLIWESSSSDEVLFLAEPTSPRGLAPETPMGYFVHDELNLSARRGLFLVTDASSDGDTATVEMVWTSGLGVDGSAELDAVLERETSKDSSFFLDCRSSDTDSHAVAIVDADLNPIRAWKIIGSDTKFVSVLPIHVECNQPSDG
jgi:hypothetical protein